MVRCPREMEKVIEMKISLGNLERVLHYHRWEENTVSNHMEQIEMQFQSSVNATECTVELFGERAGRNMSPVLTPQLDIITIQKQ